MKKNYTEPMIEIRNFDTEYVVTASGIIDGITYNKAVGDLTSGENAVSAENIFEFTL